MPKHDVEFYEKIIKLLLSNPHRCVQAMIGAAVPNTRKLEAFPEDVDQFRKCMWAVTQVPELRYYIGHFAKVNKIWARIVFNWNHIELLIDEGEIVNANKLIRECTHVND